MASSGGRMVRGLLVAIRAPEALLMVGFPAAAGLYALVRPGAGPVAALLGCLLSLAFLSLSVYAYNSWAGADTDAADPKFADDPLRSGTVTRGQLAAVALVCGVAGLAGFAIVAPRLLPATAALWICWIAYSHPRGLKSVPLAGSLVHLVGGSFMVLIPSAAVRPLDARALWLAATLSLVFASGHANHEIMDRASDAASGTRTTAVALGSRFGHILGLTLAATGYVAVAVAWRLGQLSASEALPLLAAWPLHILLGVRFLRDGLDPVAARAYRQRYRLLFALAVTLSLAAGRWLA